MHGTFQRGLFFSVNEFLKKLMKGMLINSRQEYAVYDINTGFFIIVAV